MSLLKIGSGSWKGHKLVCPKSEKTRPTKAQLRSAVFNIWAHRLEKAIFLDLFAGSGAMGLEALSQGAAHTSFVENDPKAIRSILENCSNLKCESHSRLYQSSVELFLQKSTPSYDLVFVDPPYDWMPKSLAKEKKNIATLPPASFQEGSYVQWLLDKVEPLLRPSAQLMIEQASRIKEDPSHWILGANLHYLETRRYGDSLVHRFEKKA